MAKKRTAEQEEMDITGPGVASTPIPEIDKAARAYERARDTRIEATKDETSTKKKLYDLMHDHEKTIGRAPDGALRYRSKGKLVVIAPTDEKLFVKDVPEDE